jgi:hypothetical protein
MDPFIQAFRHFLPNIEQSLVTFFHWNWTIANSSVETLLSFPLNPISVASSKWRN